jgi:hypothetical protein
MSNNTERLVNHQDAIDLGAKLDGIKNAILGTAGNGESTMSMAKILANIRNGGGPTNLPVGAELTFSESPSLSTIIAGNTVENVTTGITSESVDLATFISKIGTSAGVTTQFIYYGGAWHKDSITGDVVTLSAYGVTFTGTPKANDFITVALATSDFVMQVAAYDHYTLKNSAIVHHAVLVAKNCVSGPAIRQQSPIGYRQHDCRHPGWEIQSHNEDRRGQRPRCRWCLGFHHLEGHSFERRHLVR